MDTFTQAIVQWLAITQASSIITPFLLFLILITTCIGVRYMMKMCILLEQDIEARKLKHTHMV